MSAYLNFAKIWSMVHKINRLLFNKNLLDHKFIRLNVYLVLIWACPNEGVFINTHNHHYSIPSFTEITHKKLILIIIRFTSWELPLKDLNLQYEIEQILKRYKIDLNDQTIILWSVKRKWKRQRYLWRINQREHPANSSVKGAD